MPSEGVGQLYGGLAQGIFGRLREHQAEQDRQDAEQKASTLKYLSGLVDQATPETRPILLRTMADTIGLKGKHRGVWDMITGQGREDYHQQLSSMLSGVTGNIVGPAEYERRKGGPAYVTADDPVGEATAFKPDERTGREIVLRDPDQVALEKLRTQYGLRYENEMTKLYEQQRLTGERQSQIEAERQAGRTSLAERGAMLKAQGDILRRAHAKALAKGLAQPGEDDLQQAALEAGLASGDKDSAMRALVELRQAQAGYYKAQAQVDPLTGQLVGKAMTQGQQATLSRQLTQDAIGVKTKWDQAYARQKRLEVEEAQLRQQLQRMNPVTGQPAQPGEFTFDETAGTFARKGGGQVGAYGAKKALERLKKVSADKQAAIAEMEGLRATLASQYGDQYDATDQWRVVPREGYRSPGVTNTQPRVGQPPPFPAQATQPGQSDFQYQSKQPVAPGTIVPIKGQRYKVTGIASKGADGNIIYNLEPVR